MLCWRGAAVGSFVRSKRNRCRSPARISAGESTASRAAASSIASGMPSRSRQIWTMVSRSASSRSSSVRCERARSQNRSMQSSRTVNGWMRQTSSPGQVSGIRLVARIATAGQRRSSVLARRLAVSRTCSQLSTRSSARRRSRWRSTTASSSSSPGPAPMASAIATATSCGSDTDDRSTIHTPSGHDAASARPTSTARRVLPMPPGPTIVTSRRVAIRSRSPATSSARPTKAVNGRTRLWRVGGHRPQRHWALGPLPRGGHDGKSHRPVEVPQPERADRLDPQREVAIDRGDGLVGRDDLKSLVRLRGYLSPKKPATKTTTTITPTM